MAVRQEQVVGPVIVIIEKLQAPSTEESRRLRHPMRLCNVGEGFILVIAIERKHLLVDVGDEEILPAIAVEVSRVDAHSGARLAVSAVGDLGTQRNLLPTIFA